MIIKLFSYFFMINFINKLPKVKLAIGYGSGVFS